jgi:hypothetical protein
MQTGNMYESDMLKGHIQPRPERVADKDADNVKK